MSEARFTPGPWECKKVPTSSGRAFRIGKDAMLEPGPRGCCIIYDDYGHGTNERSANAALIAASPDLYAALEERNALVLRAQSIIAHFHDGLLTAREFEHEMTGLFTGSDVDTSAHAALAKARGEQ